MSALTENPESTKCLMQMIVCLKCNATAQPSQGSWEAKTTFSEQTACQINLGV